MRLVYHAKIEKQDDSFLVTFPDLPEAMSSGASRDEALANAMDCLDVVLAGRIKNRAEIPYPWLPRHNADFTNIEPSVLVAAKAMLYMEFRRSGIAQAELARRIGVFPTEVDGLLDTKRKSSLPLLEKAFAALGRRLVVSVE